MEEALSEQEEGLSQQQTHAEVETSHVGHPGVPSTEGKGHHSQGQEQQADQREEGVQHVHHTVTLEKSHICQI